jgi:hypothetical protein
MGSRVSVAKARTELPVIAVIAPLVEMIASPLPYASERMMHGTVHPVPSTL